MSKKEVCGLFLQFHIFQREEQSDSGIVRGSLWPGILEACILLLITGLYVTLTFLPQQSYGKFRVDEIIPHQMLMEKCAIKMWALVTTDTLRTDGFCQPLPAEKSFLPIARVKHYTKYSLNYTSSICSFPLQN